MGLHSILCPLINSFGSRESEVPNFDVSESRNELEENNIRSKAGLLGFQNSLDCEMAWPYQLVDLTTAEKHQRRLALYRYAVYSQLSALVPVLGYLLYRLALWALSGSQKAKRYSSIPSSPGAKHDRDSSAGTLVRKYRALVWWLNGEIAPSWGFRLHWLAGVSWMTWLLFLCVHQTGKGNISYFMSPMSLSSFVTDCNLNGA